MCVPKPTDVWLPFLHEYFKQSDYNAMSREMRIFIKMVSFKLFSTYFFCKTCSFQSLILICGSLFNQNTTITSQTMQTKKFALGFF